MKNTYSLPCNIAQTLNLIGDRWSLLILHRLLSGCGTYKELQDSLEGIPSNLLSERLKSLESEGLLTSELYQDHPPRYRYTPTKSGEDLDDIFNSIILWGEKHLRTCYKQLVHDTCGQGIVQQYYCPHCDTIVSPEHLIMKEAGQSRVPVHLSGTPHKQKGTDV